MGVSERETARESWARAVVLVASLVGRERDGQRSGLILEEQEAYGPASPSALWLCPSPLRARARVASREAGGAPGDAPPPPRRERDSRLELHAAAASSSTKSYTRRVSVKSQYKNT